MSHTAIVTGANRGLGLATARELARRDYRVVLTARSAESAAAAVEELAAEDLVATAATLDVSSESSVDAFFEWLDAGGLEPQIIVNNAGAVFERQLEGEWDVGVLEVDSTTVAEAFNTNTLGAYRMMLRALPRMNAAGFGRIVNVTSGMGQLSEMGGGYPAYRVSKAALNAATRVFAHEAGDNVKVNCVCPGWVKTDMGGDHASLEIAEGIRGIVWAATLPEDGPNNGFFRHGEPIPW